VGRVLVGLNANPLYFLKSYAELLVDSGSGSGSGSTKKGIERQGAVQAVSAEGLLAMVTWGGEQEERRGQ
jgi:hypothetical protein